MSPQGKSTFEFLEEQLDTFHSNKKDTSEIYKFFDMIQGKVAIDVKNKFYKKHKFELNRFKDLMSVNFIDLYTNLDTPILLLHGREDFQVDSSHSIEIFNAKLKYKTDLIFYDEANHFFTKSGMSNIGDYSKYSNYIINQVLKDIHTYIIRNIRYY